MKDKEKQIEEILEKVGIRYGMDVGGISYIVNAHKLTPYLQPKLPEHSVVLSGKQCVEIVQDNYNIGYERGNKETAEKIILSEIKTIKDIRDACVLPTPKYREGYIDCCNTILFYLKNNLAKQFDIEVQE